MRIRTDGVCGGAYNVTPASTKSENIAPRKKRPTNGTGGQPMNGRDRLIDLLCTAGWNLFPDSDAIRQVADHLIKSNIALPPVTVGQIVFIIRRPTERPAWIDECIITHMSVQYWGSGKAAAFEGYNFAATESDIGKTVFFTREEAEQAMKETEWQNDYF